MTTQIDALSPQGSISPQISIDDVSNLLRLGAELIVHPRQRPTTQEEGQSGDMLAWISAGIQVEK